MGTLADLLASEEITKELDKAFDNGYNQALEDMLELSQEWKDNHGSFLDFQRVLRSKLENE